MILFYLIFNKTIDKTNNKINKNKIKKIKIKYLIYKSSNIILKSFYFIYYIRK